MIDYFKFLHDSGLYRGYIECAFWATSDGEGLSFGRDRDGRDISEEMQNQTEKDLLIFLYTTREFLPCGVEFAQIGRDFWFSRNGHGGGFSDRDYEFADELQEIAEIFQELTIEKQADGKLYFLNL